jgi:succinate dehydrogenase hydrophobic anchor subunit
MPDLKQHPSKDKSNHWLFVLAGAVVLAVCSVLIFKMVLIIIPD